MSNTLFRTYSICLYMNANVFRMGDGLRLTVQLHEVRPPQLHHEHAHDRPHAIFRFVPDQRPVPVVEHFVVHFVRLPWQAVEKLPVVVRFVHHLMGHLVPFEVLQPSCGLLLLPHGDPRVRHHNVAVLITNCPALRRLLLK